MARELFGTDGIRGVAGEYPLTADVCEKFGRSIGSYFGKPGDSIVIGCDPRESSEMIVKALTKGISELGVNVITLGVVPTPCLAFVTKNQPVVAGVMVTASHNPYTDNGIKIFNSKGGKLSDDIESELNTILLSEVSAVANPGTLTDGKNLIEDYIDFLVGVPENKLKRIAVAVDCANGATSNIAHSVFDELNLDVHYINDKPDGKNINVHCGATDTKALQEYVVRNGLDLGIAFDGDGDRLIMVDSLGREVDGDYIMYILATGLGYDGVVATSMSNQGLESALKAKSINLVRVDVGDRYVLDGLKSTGYMLGGEKSGHIVLPELTTTGDGLLAAIKVLEVISKSNKTLDSLRDELVLLPQALVSIPLPNKALLCSEEVKEFITNQEQIFSNAGRLNIRPSGTEPIIRVMVEADQADQKAQDIAKKLEKILEEAGRAE